MTGRPGPPPLGVVVDLDDTLYPQAEYLASAATAVGAAAQRAGLDGTAVTAALRRELAAGSDTGGTIDRALLAAGVPAADLPGHVPALVAAFTAHAPSRLTPYPGVEEALRGLAAAAPLEGVEAGTTTLAGLADEQAASTVLSAAAGHTSPEGQERAATTPCPYGDGTTGLQVAAALADERTDALLALDEPDFTDGRLPW